jgi:hypothetical protein
MAESVVNVMPTNGLVRDGPLPRSLRSQTSSAVFLVRFSDSFTVVLDDLLLIRVNGKVFRFLAVRRRPWHISLVCRDKSRFWIWFQSHPISCNYDTRSDEIRVLGTKCRSGSLVALTSGIGP